MRHGTHLCPQLKSEFVSVVSVEGKERHGGGSKVKDAGADSGGGNHTVQTAVRVMLKLTARGRLQLHEGWCSGCHQL